MQVAQYPADFAPLPAPRCSGQPRMQVSQYGDPADIAPPLPPSSPLARLTAAARAAKAAWRSPDAVSAALLPPSERRVGLGFILSYLWPAGSEWDARLRVGASLGLLVVAKLFIVRVPFLFKRAIDALAGGGVGLRTGVAWMAAYGLARALYTFLQEGRYLLFAPVGQNALRRFTADAFAHVQGMDVLWLQRQSTAELSRVFARGMRGTNALLRLVRSSVSICTSHSSFLLPTTTVYHLLTTGKELCLYMHELFVLPSSATNCYLVSAILMFTLSSVVSIAFPGSFCRNSVCLLSARAVLRTKRF